MITKIFYFIFIIGFALSLLTINNISEAYVEEQSVQVQKREDFCGSRRNDCITRCDRTYARQPQQRSQCRNECQAKYRRCLETGNFS